MDEFKIQIVLLAFILSSCVSDYNFKEASGNRTLVVEGFVSNISYNDFNEIPADPRYFEIKLTWTGTDINARDEPVTNAEVTITDDLNENWDYVEVENGIYSLGYEGFKVRPDGAYKLFITLEDGSSYESDFESMISAPVNGEFSWEEDDKYIYNYLSGNETVELLKGMNLYLNFPSVEDDFYFKWDFETTYVFYAFLIEYRGDINYQCWITDELYYNNVVTGIAQNTNTKHELFFVDIDDYAVHNGFSVLVRQQTLSSAYHSYWQGINAQKEQSNLFAPPPFNLISNLHPVEQSGPVYGHFGVVQEYFYRWYFNESMLTDFEKFSEDDICPPKVDDFDRAGPPCFNCMTYGLPDRRTVTNVKPIWWED